MLPGSSPERVDREAAQGQAERAHGRDPAPHRPQPARRLRHDECSASARSSSTATCCRPTAARARRASAAATSPCTTRSRRLVGRRHDHGPPAALVLRRDQRRHRRRRRRCSTCPTSRTATAEVDMNVVTLRPVAGGEPASSRCRAPPRARRSRGRELDTLLGLAEAGLARDHRPAGRDGGGRAAAAATRERRARRCRSSSAPSANPGKVAEIRSDPRRGRRAAATPGRRRRRGRGRRHAGRATPGSRRPPIARAATPPAVADDTGLEVDALGGAPGVDTASFAGRGRDRRRQLDEAARRARRRPTRPARPVPHRRDGRVARRPRAVRRGRRATAQIAREQRAARGFGYDSVFVPGDRRRPLVRRDVGRREARPQPPRPGVRRAARHARASSGGASGRRRWTRDRRHHDLVIIGTGSGNSIPGPDLDHLDIAIVERGTFGGTCLNVGCIPTKMYVYPADLAEGARGRRRARRQDDGRRGRLASDPRPDLRADRPDRRRAARRTAKVPECPNITVYTGTAEFVGHKTLDTRHRHAVTRATGSCSPPAAGRIVPDIPGLELGPRVHTSDTIMRLDELPRSVARLRRRVHRRRVRPRVQRVRRATSPRSSARPAAARPRRRHRRRVHGRRPPSAGRLLTDDEPTAFHAGADGVDDGAAPGGPIAADIVLVATGRRPTATASTSTATGVDVDERRLRRRRRLPADDASRASSRSATSARRGSSSTSPTTRCAVVRHNLLHPDAMIRSDHRFVPSAVFTHPQIATVGLTEEQAIDRGVDYVAGPPRLRRHRRRVGTRGHHRVRQDPRRSRAPGCSSAPTSSGRRRPP